MFIAVDMSVAVATSVDDSKEIIFEDWGGGRVYIPSGSSITSLTWYDAPEPGGTYHAANDEDSVALVQTVEAGKSYEIPVSLAGAGALKIVGDATGTVTVTLKG